MAVVTPRNSKAKNRFLVGKDSQKDRLLVEDGASGVSFVSLVYYTESPYSRTRKNYMLKVVDASETKCVVFTPTSANACSKYPARKRDHFRPNP